MKVDKVVRLPLVDSGLQHSIVRLNNRNMDSQKKDRSRFFRREPLIVINQANKAKVLRYAMGHAGQSICKTHIALDYDAADALSIRFKDEVNLIVRRAHFWEVWQWLWRHPELSVQLSIRLGFAGAMLGILGFLTGILPLVIT